MENEELFMIMNRKDNTILKDETGKSYEFEYHCDAGVFLRNIKVVNKEKELCVVKIFPVR